MAHRAVALNVGSPWSFLALVAFVASTALAPVARAQSEAATAAAAFDRAERAIVNAHAGPDRPHPDVAAWRAALTLADEAVRMARPLGGDALLRALRQSARAYAITGWYSRAYAAWIEYLEAGGALGEAHQAVPGPGGEPIILGSDAELFVQVGVQLGFARYQVGELDAAERFYERVLEVRPDEPESLRWLGRIAYERGDAEAAVDYWERLVSIDPDDRAATYYLERSRERVAYGSEASDAYQEGIAAYEAGDLDQAFSAFAAAFSANPEFAQAAVWAGRTSLEAGRPEVAVPYWERALELRPDDARAAWFLEVASAQQRWGVEAGRAYYQGQSAYDEGDLDAAAAAFEAATEANPEMVDAWVWAARSHQEAGRPDEAVQFWQGALERDPDDERARWFLALALQQTAFGPEAGTAFMQGLASYQAGDAAAAEEAFQAAVEAQPGFAAAWGYLGRIAFQDGRYLLAAAAYGRAAQLEPDDEDYAFFAEEAMRVAEEETAEEETQ
ncbi:MAG: tetratricopeptide repeat protein [Trueperaceae bacterium]